MKILFIGSVEFSARALEKLITLEACIVGVCTLRSSIYNSDFVDLRPIANRAAIAVNYTDDINSDETLSWVRELSPDIIFCFGWSRLIRKPLLEITPLGVLGFHPSALPLNRGRHPIIWALVLGLTKTGSTFFFMNEHPDAGDILSQELLEISDDDSSRSLYDKITQLALRQIEDFLPKLESGNFICQPQDHSIANIWRKRNKFDGIIDWRMSAISIHNLVRGLTKPYVGAEIIWADECIKIWKTEIVMEVEKNIEAGKILEVSDCGILVKAGIGAVRLIEFTPSFTISVGDYI